MVLCNVECVQRVSRYLDATPGKLDLSDNYAVRAHNTATNKVVEGFSTVIQALVKDSKCPDILGSDSETQALSRQWLEYMVVCVNYADASPANASRVLKELNTTLRDTTYITGTRKTIADVALYYALHSIMRQFTHQQKAQYVHLSRWFDNVQQEEKLRQNLDLIHFNLMHIFL